MEDKIRACLPIAVSEALTCELAVHAVRDRAIIIMRLFSRSSAISRVTETCGERNDATGSIAHFQDIDDT